LSVTAEPVLALEGIGKTYQGRTGPVRAVSSLSLEVAAGEFVALQGQSGSGKTTVLLCAGGLLRPDSGRVAIEGRDLYALPVEERARLRASAIGFIFQEFHLLPYLSVMENVLVPSLGKRSPDASRRAEELIERFGLGPRARHLPAELSTGERQRVALARALLNRPPLLLADEPTGNLDPENGRTVLDHLSGFAGEGGAVLLVTHDDDAAARAGRRVRLESPE
jgi:ABC-type lipoprotein export system ATPase subunit